MIPNMTIYIQIPHGLAGSYCTFVYCVKQLPESQTPFKIFIISKSNYLKVGYNQYLNFNAVLPDTIIIQFRVVPLEYDHTKTNVCC